MHYEVTRVEPLKGTECVVARIDPRQGPKTMKEVFDEMERQDMRPATFEDLINFALQDGQPFVNQNPFTTTLVVERGADPRALPSPDSTENS